MLQSVKCESLHRPSVRSLSLTLSKENLYCLSEFWHEDIKVHRFLCLPRSAFKAPALRYGGNNIRFRSDLFELLPGRSFDNFPDSGLLLAPTDSGRPFSRVTPIWRRRLATWLSDFMRNVSLLKTKFSPHPHVLRATLQSIFAYANNNRLRWISKHRW